MNGVRRILTSKARYPRTFRDGKVGALTRAIVCCRRRLRPPGSGAGRWRRAGRGSGRRTRLPWQRSRRTSRWWRKQVLDRTNTDRPLLTHFFAVAVSRLAREQIGPVVREMENAGSVKPEIVNMLFENGVISNYDVTLFFSGFIF